MLPHTSVYGAQGSSVVWTGELVGDPDAFKTYLAGAVYDRLRDVEQKARFEADMHALTTSEMGVEMLQRLLSSEPEKEPWEVGEALAECLLESNHGSRWPAHSDRDKRTPKASLPGADLIGFVGDDADPWLALGEVKTSTDVATPPGVMSGRSGMVHQLDRLAHRIDIHHSVLKWLHPRCLGTSFWPVYQRATTRYLESQGRDIVLYGMLMRDTRPNDLDLRSRAEALTRLVSPPTKVLLAAWYLPVPIEQWVASARRAA